MFLAYIPEIEDCTENVVKNIECLVHKNTAVFINQYVQMSVMICFMASQLKKNVQLLIQKVKAIHSS